MTKLDPVLQLILLLLPQRFIPDYINTNDDADANTLWIDHRRGVKSPS